MKTNKIVLAFGTMLICALTWSVNAQEKAIRMNTVLSSGQISFGLKTVDNTPVSIDWGDGTPVNYTMDSEYKEFSSNVKGKDLVIKGDIKMLNCVSNKLTNIDLSGAPNLEVLQAALNFVNKIDVKHCPKLEVLEIFQCAIKELDLSNNKKLSRLVVSQNFLEKLDVSGCPELEYFDCSRMGRMEQVDLSQNKKIKNLLFNECSFAELKLSPEAPLVELWCEKNQLKKLDLTPFQQLQILSCKNNKGLDEIKLNSSILSALNCMNCDLSSLDLSLCAESLTYLMMGGNINLSNIDFSPLANLKDLGLSNCGFVQLSLKNKEKLEQLWCTGNELIQIDASDCTSLKRLQAGKNKLTEVKIPTSGTLETLLLPENDLKRIDLTYAPNLKTLDLGKRNQISSLYLTPCRKLQQLNLKGNPIKNLQIRLLDSLNMLGLEECGLTSCELNRIYEQLPSLPTMSGKVNLYNGTKTDKEALGSNTDLAEARNWKPKVKGDNSGCDDAIEDIENPTFEIKRLSQKELLVSSLNGNGTLRFYSLQGSLVALFDIREAEQVISRPAPGLYLVEFIAAQDGRTSSMKLGL